MDALTAGFGDELQKLANRRLTDEERELRDVTRRAGRPSFRNIRGSGSPRQRDYLASAALSAASFPAISLLQAMVGRKLRNRSLVQVAKGLSKRKSRKLLRNLESGPIIAGSHLHRRHGQLTKEDLLTRAIAGGTAGSLMMALRDRFAGSTPVK